jgi:hypothetical protein
MKIKDNLNDLDIINPHFYVQVKNAKKYANRVFKKDGTINKDVFVNYINQLICTIPNNERHIFVSDFISRIKIT